MVVVHGDGTRGLPDKAPFDGIVVAAGGPYVPHALLDQLAIGGRPIMPLGGDHDKQMFRRLRRTSQHEYQPTGAPPMSRCRTPFQRNCAACHGGAGEDKEKYPPIPGKLSEADYIAKVRAGVNAMPAFSADFVTDAQLAADFASLKKLAGQPGGLGAAADGPAAWSDAKVNEIYQRGLAVWRKPGSIDGQACTNCHSADGVELAIIGFTDDSVLRRGQTHLSPEDALTVRDFVHAQRRRLGIARTCATDWRPFQPGGTVLPRATAAEQDASFMTELKKRNLLVATGKVVSLDDAKKAFAEIQAINLRELPNGVPLPRWSEDKFNGPGHRDINDYMPPVPTAAYSGKRSESREALASAHQRPFLMPRRR